MNSNSELHPQTSLFPITCIYLCAILLFHSHCVFTTLHSFCVHHFLDLLVLSCAWQMSYCGILFVLKVFRYLYYCVPSARTCYVAPICFQRFIPAVMTRGSLFHFMVTLYPIMWICPSLFIHFFVNVIWIRTTFGEVGLSFSVSLFLSSQT